MIKNNRILSILFVSLFLSSALFIGAGMMPVSQIALSNTEQNVVTAGYPTTDPDNRNTPVSILVYTEFADTTTVSPNEFRNTIDAIENTFGPEFYYDNLTTYTQLSAMLPGHDILLLLEQENMNQTHVPAIASAWTSQLTAFVNEGGIVIALDCHGEGTSDLDDGPTMQILNETGLMTVYTPVGGNGWTNNLVEPTDALARGVSASWTAPMGSVSFVTSDATVVVDDGTDAIAAHKIIGAGHVVLLGFDFFITEPNSEILLANAIRLHRHVVFDYSNANIQNILTSYKEFANDLADNGFAVSSMTTFDTDILDAAEVFVVPIADYHGGPQYSTQEVDAIEDFVNAGGGLFIISDGGVWGNVTDIVNERFGFVRNKSILYDSDDFNPAGSGYSAIYSTSENINNHSVTLNVNALETWAGSGLESYPSNAVPLIVTDSDGTSTFDSMYPADGVAFSAAATYGLGRVVFIGDSDLFVDNDFDGDGTESYNDRDSEFFARNCIGWLSAAGIEEKIILFDQSKTPNCNVQDWLAELGALLTENGYTLKWMSDFLPDLVAGADILFIMDGTEVYNSTEIAIIESFVSNGGGLYLVGAWGEWIDEVEPISWTFGFGNGSLTELVDTDDTVGPSEYVLYDGANIGDHPITQGISSLELYLHGTILTGGSIIPVITTDTDGTSEYATSGDPANGLAVMAATSYDAGRVFYSADYMALRGAYDSDFDGVPDIFYDDDGDGFVNLYDSDYSLLVLNAFHWLSVHYEPTVTVTFPNGGEVLNGTEIITWEASDTEGDPLIFEVFYSDNGGADWSPLATGLTVQEFAWNTTAHDDGTDYMIRVFVSDGEFSVFDDSNDPFELDNFDGGGLPGPGPFDDPTTIIIIIIIAGIVIIIIIIIVKKKK